MKIRDCTELVDVPYNANRSQWKSSAAFTDRSVIMKLSSETACAIGFGYALTAQVFQRILHTVKIFHLELFAMHSIIAWILISIL